MWTKHSGEIFIKFLATKNPAVILMEELTFGNVQAIEVEAIIFDEWLCLHHMLGK
jgi:hypothetical protein